MAYKVVKYGNPVLRKVGEPIRTFDAQLETLVNEMLETMREYEGVGLAAQQVGLPLQLAVIDITEADEKRPSRMWIDGKEVNPIEQMPVLLINPKITTIKTKEIGVEGCLSFPGITADIARSKRVKVETQTLKGEPFQFEAAGLLSRAVLHEYDHLQGILFTDHMDPEEKRCLRAEIEAIRIEGMAEAGIS